MVDRFDRLARGKQFEAQSAHTVINDDWVKATVWFNVEVCQYKVKFHYGGHSVEQSYDKQEDAVSRYERLVVDYELD